MTLCGSVFRERLASALHCVVEQTQDFTDSAYTSHEHREKILLICDRLKLELNQLLSIGVCLVSHVLSIPTYVQIPLLLPRHDQRLAISLCVIVSSILINCLPVCRRQKGLPAYSAPCPVFMSVFASFEQEEADSTTPTEDLELAVEQTRGASNDLKHQVRERCSGHIPWLSLWVDGRSFLSGGKHS